MGASCSCTCATQVEQPIPEKESRNHTPSQTERARNLASQITPFIPRRTVEAFLDGQLNCDNSGSILWPPEPRMQCGAVLLVDISGFTKLSEAYSKAGTEGIESFSLLISSFFAKMTDIIEAHHGDIDCFAGDAFLVVFQSNCLSAGDDSAEGSRPSRASSEAERMPISEATHLAVSCVRAIAKELRTLDEASKLSVHAAIAAGNLIAVECAGMKTLRSEAFLLGEPLLDLGRAMPLSQSSELIIAPSALEHVRDKVHGEAREGGHVCVVLEQPADRKAKVAGLSRRRLSTAMMAPLSGARPARRLTAGASSQGPQQSHAVQPAGVMDTEAVQRWRADRLELVTEKVLSVAELARAHAMGSRSGFEGNGTPKFLVRQRLSKMKSFSSKRFSSSRLTLGATGHPRPASPHHILRTDNDDVDCGAEVLLRFVPWFVRQRCVLGLQMDMLAENREVSVLFISGRVQVASPGKELIHRLQKLLGSIMDVANGDFSGTTRQVTVDEKGLAAIFVFGLPGLMQHSHLLRCVMAGIHIRNLVKGHADVTLSAGLATGSCYCGLVGNPRTRCEYAVMGDTVNTAARLAAHAAKTNQALLCGQSVQEAVVHDREAMDRIHLVPAGMVKLKGKAKEVSVYSPEVKQVFRMSNSFSSKVEILGREEELSTAVGFILADRKSECVKNIMIMEGTTGIGKTSLLQSAVLRAMKSSNGDVPKVVFCQASIQSSSRFHLCHAILGTLLSNDPHDPVAKLESDYVQSMSPSALPPVIRPHMKEIARLRGEQPIEQAQGFLSLYAELIFGRVVKNHVILVVDNAQHLENTMLCTVIRAVLGDRNKPGPPCGKLILLTTHPLVMKNPPTGIKCPELAMDPRVKHLKLEALGRYSVVRMGAQLIRCQTLSERLAGWLQDQSLGNPLQIRELCKWLKESFVLQIDGEGTADMKEEAVTWRAPSLKKLIQGQIDQLPAHLGIVLRCAAVLGFKFEDWLLLAILPEQIVTDKGGLESSLESLSAVNMVQKASSRNEWQFPNKSYQEVAYGCMLHSNQRDLHRKAARALRDAALKLGEDGNSCRWQDIDVYKRLQQEIAYHRLKIIATQSAHSSSRQAVLISDVMAAVEAVAEIVSVSMSQGNLSEAWKHQVRNRPLQMPTSA
mmetsp:Transcript_3596/g.8578  ORF Transcript_3596/g.8578 Transcript_3596/m.8578 type:complete len:1140 (-) Transcript_3596:2301-5720(-)